MAFASLRRFFAVSLFLAADAALASPSCTLIADAQTGAVLVQQGPCDQRNSPASTFKVALAVMGYQSGTLLDARRDDIAGIRVRDEFLAALPGLVTRGR